MRKQLIALATLSMVWGCSEESLPEPTEIARPVKLLTIERGSRLEYEFPAQVKASKQAMLSFRVPGQIEKKHVLSGELVQAGQLLIELDDKPYQLAEEVARANYDLARVQHERNTKLIGESLISQQDYDQSQSDLLVAEAAWKDAQEQVRHCRIYSPYNGVIANTYQEAYKFVQAQQPVLSVHAVGNIDLEIQIPERVFKQLGHISASRDPKEFLQLDVTFPTRPELRFVAEMKELDTVADSATSSYTATLTLPDPQQIVVLSGMSASVFAKIHDSITNSSQTLPETALIKKNEKIYVWQVDAKTQRLKQVPIRMNSDRQLLSGLHSGAQIVAVGVDALQADQLVKPWVKEQGL